MEPCPFCLSEIPSAATRCPHCTGDLKMPSDSPDLAGFWIAGVLLALLGAAIAAAGGDTAPWIGFVLAGVGLIFVQIATIAFGVSLGGRHRDARIYRTRRAQAEPVTPEA